MGEIAINPRHNVHKKYRNMNLVNPYIFATPALTYNTYIGGVSATISTAALLASKLGISVGAISNFTVVGSDIKCKIAGSYAIPGNSFTNDSLLTYYKDMDGLATTIYGDETFKNAVNLTEVYFPNCTSIPGITHFVSCQALQKVYVPRCTVFGATTGFDNIFTSITNHSWKIYCHPSLATCNGGSPDGDITDAIAKGATIRYVTDFTAPNQITDLTIGTVYATTLQLNFTPPSSTNAIDFYECYANGVYKNTISGSGQYVTGLTLNTAYDIEVKPVDIFYNKSTSNIVAQTTSATYVIPTADLVSYYKMQNDVLDSWGTNNGTPTDITYASGLVGQAAVFNGSTSFISIADADNLSFTNGTNDLPFSVSGIFNFGANTSNRRLVMKFGNSGFREWAFSFIGGNSIYLSCNNSTGTTNIYNYISFLPTVNQNYNITATYDGSGSQFGINIYVNGILIAGTSVKTGAYTNMTNTSQPVIIGKWITQDYFNGKIDEVSIFSKALSAVEVSEINTKLNSGQSLI